MTIAAPLLPMLRCNKSRARGRGFTLMEMMIALSVLAMSLTWLIEASVRAVDAENHARLMTTATFLTRQLMVELEDELSEKGMQDDAFASEKAGDFDEEAYKRFRWRRIVDKITMPGQSDVQTALGAMTGMGGGGLGGLSGGAGSGGGGAAAGAMGALGGMGGGASTNMFASQFGIIKEVLESGIRKATVRVSWTEHGDEKFVEVSQFLTDPRRVDQAIQLPALGGAGAPGIGGGAGAAGAGSIGGSSNAGFAPQKAN